MGVWVCVHIRVRWDVWEQQSKFMAWANILLQLWLVMAPPLMRAHPNILHLM